ARGRRRARGASQPVGGRRRDGNPTERHANPSGATTGVAGAGRAAVAEVGVGVGVAAGVVAAEEAGVEAAPRLAAAPPGRRAARAARLPRTAADGGGRKS